jgi:sucrose-6-phosphate hydrolase SacC (GH32 family)
MLPILLSIALLALVDRPDILVADFEGPGYGEWTTDGTAFGDAPAPGRLPNQMVVGSFKGAGLVNSFLGGDAATGTLTSPPFRIERKRINFLIGGGRHPGETCINLLVDGEVARTETGHDSEYLRGATWDVAEFEGKDARIVIVDARTDGWGHINVDQIVQSDAEPKSVDERDSLLAQANASVAAAAEVVKDDPSRPTFHILPRANWLNDPNGLLHHNGWYHVFYQHNPYGDEWGNMHWGHVRSKDLAHWEHLPIALWPSKSRGEDHVFSGSAWVRKDGTPILFYTSIGANRLPEQWAAVAEDGDLIKWKKHPASPILTEALHGDTKIHEWRDPYLFDLNGTVHMVCGGNTNASKGGEGVVCVYRADNDELTKWTYLGVLFKHPDAEVKNIECPIFFKLEGRWVLIVSQGQPVDWFVGDLDEKTMRFTPTARGKVDYGQVYAPSVLPELDASGRSFSPQTAGDTLWGWINGVPAGKGWRHCLTIPRAMEIDEKGSLLQTPFHRLPGLARENPPIETDIPLRERNPYIVRSATPALDITARFQLGTARRVGLHVLRSQDGTRAVPITYDRVNEMLEVAGTKAPLTLVGEDADFLDLRVFVDHSIIEVFAEGGRVCVTRVVEFHPGDVGLDAFAEAGSAFLGMELLDMSSIWR